MDRVDAQHRWTSILPALGMSSHYLRNKHGPCPVCGGKDRFRFDDKEGNGTFFCNGRGAGNGFDLVQRFCKVDFMGALDLVRPLAGNSPVQQSHERRPSPEECKRMREELWHRSTEVSANDPVGQYLRGRLGRFYETKELRTVQAAPPRLACWRG
jgi:putative DNA primase/helicase